MKTNFGTSEALTCVRYQPALWLLTYDQLEGRYLVWLVIKKARIRSGK